MSSSGAKTLSRLFRMRETRNQINLSLKDNIVHEATGDGDVRLQIPFTSRAVEGIAFRLYPDSRPRNLEIAPLQKGLVLVDGDVELVEEGAGFGAPIVKYDDATMFSSTAQTYSKQLDDGGIILTKVFHLDAISKKKVQDAFINDSLYEFLHSVFEKAYLSRRQLRPIFDWTMRLRKVLGMKTEFVQVQPRGKVIFTYRCRPNRVEISVKFSALDKRGCREILILNEQGASTFRRFFDTDGSVLLERDVGGWARVVADCAGFSNVSQTISFVLERKEGALLYRGREQIDGRFSWAGMTYSLSPHIGSFSYVVRTWSGKNE